VAEIVFLESITMKLSGIKPKLISRPKYGYKYHMLFLLVHSSPHTKEKCFSVKIIDDM